MPIYPKFLLSEIASHQMVSSVFTLIQSHLFAHIRKAHKWFNAPYACGIFFTRHLQLLRYILGGSSSPAYLSSSNSDSSLPLDLVWTAEISSPMHTNIENSRRFIALPLYCALISTGRQGYEEIVERNIRFARDIASWMCDEEAGGRWYEVLNLRQIALSEDKDEITKTVPLNIVLFRPRDGDNVPVIYRSSGLSPSAVLVKAINGTRRMYVSPGAYKGGAVRIAVSNWMTAKDDGGYDLEVVKGALTEVMDPCYPFN